MSCPNTQSSCLKHIIGIRIFAYLLERLVVHKAGGIFGYLKLTLLYCLAELPVRKQEGVNNRTQNAMLTERSCWIESMDA